MQISIFDVVGPVMVGPSSSHTAGAARLSRIARKIANKPFHKVRFALSGSFAKTYKGHGTDRALVAGALGLREDDERIADAFQLADEAGMAYEFAEEHMEGMHENTVHMTFYRDDGKDIEVTGSSVGGGMIEICAINGFETGFTAQYSTLVIRQTDQKGVLSDTTRVLAENGINIGVMKLSRRSKGGDACCIIEVDGTIPDAVVEQLEAVKGVYSVRALNIDETEGC